MLGQLFLALAQCYDNELCQGYPHTTGKIDWSQNQTCLVSPLIRWWGSEYGENLKCHTASPSEHKTFL